jgi:soluble lytic murein transglycosylase
LLCVPLLLGWAQEAPPGGAAASSDAADPADVGAGAANGHRSFRLAAEAMRRHDCRAALAALPPSAIPAPPVNPGSLGNSAASTSAEQAASAALLADLMGGFYAHACEQPALAEERLFAARLSGGTFEDWRLLLLADSAHARGHILLAKASLARLLGDYPASPLRPRALLAAANLDWERSDAEGAVALVREGRRGLANAAGQATAGAPAGPNAAPASLARQGNASIAATAASAASQAIPGSDEQARLDALEWEIGLRRNDPKLRAEAARSLLTSAPQTAAQLGVAEAFRRSDGTLSWSDILTPEQLRQRARALSNLQLEPSALATLDAMPAGDRDLQWALLKAEVLTRAHRGGDALALLLPLQSGDPQHANASLARAERDLQPPFKGQRMEALEWALAQASDDAAAAQHGRSAAAQAQRRKLRLAAELHLRAAAEIGADRQLSARALRALYAHLLEEDLFDRALEALRQLRALDPKDTTGATFLWGRGWQEFSHANFTGSVGYWTELIALYPEDSASRRAHYWIGRSFEALGQRDRAREVYAQLAAADTSDFYRRNSLVRLARFNTAAVSPSDRAAAADPLDRADRREAWPVDPALTRAQLLSDFGLDDLAQSELDLVRGKAQQRPAAALQALILARRGERRKSVQAIREAFPALGGPLQAGVPEEALKLYYPLDFASPIRAAATTYGVPPALVFGVIRQESAFDANAQSWAGARGLMQLMPGTARELARNLGLSWSHDSLSDPAFNVKVGTSYLHQVLAMFDGNVELALAGYNGGPYRIKRLWRESGGGDLDRFVEGLSIEESKIYVKRILVLSDSYRRLYPHAAG